MTSAPGRLHGTRLADAMALGATMYVPVVHPAVGDIVAGRRYPGLRSIVLCLEDALHPRDVARGLRLLRALLNGPPTTSPTAPPAAAPPAATSPAAASPAAASSTVPSGGGGAHRPGAPPGPRLFVRPRTLEMARTIAGFEGVERVEGFVIPKLRIEDIAPWWRLAAAADLRLMPTLESPWVFDPLALREFGAALDEQDRRRLVAVRVGGNDLLASMGLRRVRGRTVHDGPLAWALSQLMCQLGARGYPLTAPVFDVLDDPRTLARECRLDADFGFVGKTAVHPEQIAVIERGFAIDADELAIARDVLARDADAVFRRRGMMLEPATHRAWAERALARAATYGVVPPGTVRR